MSNPFNDSWVSVRDSMREAEITRRGKRNNAIKFGIDYLDDALFGIFQDDLVLLGAQSGKGKTHLAVKLAQNAAKQGKKVYYFALEAAKGEIEQRLIFSQLNITHITQGQYMTGVVDEAVEKETDRVINENLFLGDKGGDVFVYYKGVNFSPKDLERELLGNQHKGDLFIIDHFHFLDYDPSQSEQSDHKAAMRVIRSTALSMGKPVILLAHMNKAFARTGNPIPGMYDFYGTSDLINIATRVITLSTRVPEETLGGPASADKGLTVFYTAKERYDGSKTNFFGITNYSPINGEYLPGYLLAEYDTQKLLTRSDRQFPYWAKNAKSIYVSPATGDT